LQLRTSKQSWLLAGCFVLYLLGTCAVAVRRPLWFDELFTYHLSRLGNVSDLWSALRAGTDLNPPLSYVLVRAAHGLFGETALATRLPAILSFWVMGLCLFAFVARRCSASYAWIALLLPFATAAFPFAYEGRPYALVLAACGLALVCWQWAAAGTNRLAALCGLALGLGFAVSNHYYGAFLFIPLALGELTRTITRKRLDLGVWAALACAALPLVCFYPLLEQVRPYAVNNFYPKPGWDFVQQFYLDLLGRLVSPLVVILVFLAFATQLVPAPTATSSAPAAPALPLHELVAMIGLLALPVLGVAVSKLHGTSGFTVRYVLSAVLGFSILFASVCHRLLNGSTRLGAGVAVILAGWIALLGVWDYRRAAANAQKLAEGYSFLQDQNPSDLPVVVVDPLLHPQLSFYRPATLGFRMVYVSGPGADARYFEQHQYTVEGALLALRRWADLDVEDYDTFTGAHPQFLVFGENGWILSGLRARGVRLERRGSTQEQNLYFVDLKR
jgi:hypothetical protein